MESFTAPRKTGGLLCFMQLQPRGPTLRHVKPDHQSSCRNSSNSDCLIGWNVNSVSPARSAKCRYEKNQIWIMVDTDCWFWTVPQTHSQRRTHGSFGVKFVGIPDEKGGKILPIMISSTLMLSWRWWIECSRSFVICEKRRTGVARGLGRSRLR